MSKAFNIGIILWVLLTTALISSCVALYIIKENEIEKRISLEKQLEDVTKAKEEIAAGLEELREAKAEMELALALKEKDFQNLQEKFDFAKLENNLLKEKRSTLVEKLSSTQKEYLQLKESFEQLQQAKEMLEGKLKNIMSSGVKLETIIVEPESEVAAELESPIKETVKGEVLVVNKKYEFLVIDLGLLDGITKDSEISVYRDAELIAVGQIEKLYENISAVVIDERKQLDKVKVGDVVVGTIGKGS